MASQDKARNLRHQKKKEDRRKKQKLKEERKQRQNTTPSPTETTPHIIIPSEAIHTPVVFRALTLEGSPDPEDPTQLEGRELAYWWYDSQEDRRNGINGEQVSVLDIRKCYFMANPKIAEHQDWRCAVPDVEYYQCEALLIENVSPNSRYGKWLRKQAHQGNLPLDDSIEYLEKPIRFRIAIGTATKRVMPLLKAFGPKVVQKKRCLLDMNFSDKESNALSSLQVDRVWEFYSMLLGVYPRLARDISHSAWEREKLEASLLQIEALELEAAEVLRSCVGEVEQARALWESAKSKLESTTHQTNTAQEILERQLREAETQLQVLEQGYETAKADLKVLEQRVIRSHSPDADEHHRNAELRREAEQLRDTLLTYPSEITEHRETLKRCQNRLKKHKRETGYNIAVQKKELNESEVKFQNAAREELRASSSFDELFAAREFIRTRLSWEQTV